MTNLKYISDLKFCTTRKQNIRGYIQFDLKEVDIHSEYHDSRFSAACHEDFFLNWKDYLNNLLTPSQVSYGREYDIKIEVDGVEVNVLEFRKVV